MKTIKTNRITSLLLSTWIGLSMIAYATVSYAKVNNVQSTQNLSAEDIGLNIALETERRDSGFGDYVTDAKLTLINEDNESFVRDFKMTTVEVPGDGDKRISVFSTPKDIRGTTTLTFSHALEANDQWIYLPAVKRTKRISAKNKTGPFVGSEFSYEDISSWEVKKYSYRFIEESERNGHPCFLVENTPNYQYSGYSRQLECVDKEIYQPRELLYFDKQGREYKRLEFFDYQQFAGQYWRPGKIIMTNLQNGRKSIIDFSNYEFATGVQPDDLSPNKLEVYSKQR